MSEGLQAREAHRVAHEVRLERLHPAEVRAAMAATPIAWLPLGAIEFHAEHLPFGTDGFTAHAVVERAARQAGGVALPWSALTFGTLHLEWTLRYDRELVEAMLRQTIEQLGTHGARVVIVHTGHGPLDLAHLIKRVCAEVEQSGRFGPAFRAYGLCYLELNAALGAGLGTDWPVAIDHGSIPSHYHDDHLAGVPWLQQTQGTAAWIYDRFAEMVARPADWKVPCLLGEPIRVDRALTDSERISWADWSFDVFHMPGHTWWAMGLVGEVDGVRVALTGDNLLAGAVSPLRAAAPIYRNRMRIDSIATGVRRLIDFEPELLLTGHTGAIEVSRPMLDDFLAWARQLEGAFSRLVAVPELVDEALDPDFVVCFPYLQQVTPGDTIGLDVQVTNHGPSARLAHVELVVPAGWTVQPATASADVESGAMVPLSFRVGVSPKTEPGRAIVVADLTLGERRYGQRAEAIVDVTLGARGAIA